MPRNLTDRGNSLVYQELRTRFETPKFSFLEANISNDEYMVYVTTLRNKFKSWSIIVYVVKLLYDAVAPQKM